MVSSSEHITVELFNDLNKINSLIDSVEKNLFSQHEMVNLLEFINLHESLIKGNKIHLPDIRKFDESSSQSEPQVNGKADREGEVENDDHELLKNFQIDVKAIEKFIKPQNLIVPNENRFKNDIKLSPNLLKPRALCLGKA